MKNIIIVIYLSLSALIMVSCQKDDILENTINDKVQIAEKKLSTGEQLSIFADKDLSVGYQNIYVKLENESKAISAEKLKFSPIMDMGMMKHGAPSSSLSFDASIGMYKGYVVFTMASGESGSWILELKIDNESVSIPVIVKEAESGNVPVKTFIGSDNRHYVLALIEPSKPKIGMNDLEVVVFSRETMFSYLVEDDFLLDFHPEMTSMNHGSPNNQSPLGLGSGRYKGKVNFTMSGDWRLYFDIEKASSKIVNDLYLDVLF